MNMRQGTWVQLERRTGNGIVLSNSLLKHVYLHTLRPPILVPDHNDVPSNDAKVLPEHKRVVY